MCARAIVCEAVGVYEYVCEWLDLLGVRSCKEAYHEACHTLLTNEHAQLFMELYFHLIEFMEPIADQSPNKITLW